MKNLYDKLNKIMNGMFDYASMGLFGKTFDDRVRHSVLLFLINNILFFVYFLFFNLTTSLPFAIVTSIVIMFVREYFDKKYTTGFSKKDIFYGNVGIFISTILIILLSNMF